MDTTSSAVTYYSKVPLYRELSTRIVAYQNCAKGPTLNEWEYKHRAIADILAREMLPRGSGFDRGTTIEWDACRADCIVLLTSFHHMDSHGSYDGWSDHRVTVRPSFLDSIGVAIGGRDRNGWKNYAHDVFAHALHQMIPANVAAMIMDISTD